MDKILELEIKLQQIKNELELLKKPQRSKQASNWDRYDRNGFKSNYYSVGSERVVNNIDTGSTLASELYEIANYNTNKKQMERIKFEQDLYRKMLRFAQQNNTNKIDWNNQNKEKYCLCYCYETNKIEICVFHYTQHFGQVYFTSKDIADKAMELFKDELIEYFTKESEDEK